MVESIDSTPWAKRILTFKRIAKARYTCDIIRHCLLLAPNDMYFFMAMRGTTCVQIPLFGVAGRAFYGEEWKFSIFHIMKIHSEFNVIKNIFLWAKAHKKSQ